MWAPRGLMFLLLLLFCWIKGTFLLWCIPKGCSGSITPRNQLKEVSTKKHGIGHLRSVEAVCCSEHPAGVDEAAPAQEVLRAPYGLEDACYPRLGLNLCLLSTNNLEHLADAPLTTRGPCEKKNFVQVFVRINSKFMLLKIKLKKQTKPQLCWNWHYLPHFSMLQSVSWMADPLLV